MYLQWCRVNSLSASFEPSPMQYLGDWFEPRNYWLVLAEVRSSRVLRGGEGSTKEHLADRSHEQMIYLISVRSS